MSHGVLPHSSTTYQNQKQRRVAGLAKHQYYLAQGLTNTTEEKFSSVAQSQANSNARELIAKIKRKSAHEGPQ